ncbi:Copia protein, partial [Mucuna pruriens]
MILNTIVIPNTISKALSKGEWRHAMKEGMNALERNNIWEMVDMPKGKNIANGSLKRYKERLFAKGYTQTYGVDYQETFALVTNINTQLLQYDVKNAFLHSDLNEEIYMNILPKFEGDRDSKVSSFKSSLEHGLGDSQKLQRNLGISKTKGERLHLIYVDGIIIIGNDEKEKGDLKQKLIREFEIKELGKLKYFLGIEVAYSNEGSLYPNKNM